MSNSRITRELKKQQSHTKLYEEYKKKEDLILNYQVCKAFFKGAGVSVADMIFLILKRKYNYNWQAKFIRQAINAVKGQRNPVIDIPQFNYKEHQNDILSRFVRDNFDNIMKEWYLEGYPLIIKNLGEKYDKILAQ